MAGLKEQRTRAALEEELAQVEGKIAILDERRSELKVELSRMNCPFKMGDLVVRTTSTWGIKKELTWEVIKILPGGSRNGDFRFLARRVLKDGTPGKRERVFYHWDAEKMEKVKQS